MTDNNLQIYNILEKERRAYWAEKTYWANKEKKQTKKERLKEKRLMQKLKRVT